MATLEAIMGSSEFSKNYEEKLVAELEELYANYMKHNESKNIFAAARTPATLFTIMVVAYLLSGIFGIIGLESLANLLNIFMGLALILFLVWAYVRYSGEYRDIGSHIDNFADVTWENALGPVVMKVMHGGAAHAAKTAITKKKD